jgi:hypothetical protein
MSCCNQFTMQVEWFKSRQKAGSYVRFRVAGCIRTSTSWWVLSTSGVKNGRPLSLSSVLAAAQPVHLIRPWHPSRVVGPKQRGLTGVATQQRGGSFITRRPYGRWQPVRASYYEGVLDTGRLARWVVEHQARGGLSASATCSNTQHAACSTQHAAHHTT